MKLHPRFRVDALMFGIGTWRVLFMLKIRRYSRLLLFVATSMQSTTRKSELILKNHEYKHKSSAQAHVPRRSLALPHFTPILVRLSACAEAATCNQRGSAPQRSPFSPHHFFPSEPSPLSNPPILQSSNPPSPIGPILTWMTSQNRLIYMRSLKLPWRTTKVARA